MKRGSGKLAAVLAGLLALLWCGSALGANLVINGGFELGNQDFGSDYLFSSNLVPEGIYAIGNNPHDYHSGWPNPSVVPYEGTKMMIINGATISGQDVWTQTVSGILPTTQYFFSTRVASIIPTAPAKMAFYIGADKIGELQAGGGTAWELFYGTWTSGTGTTADLALVNLNTAQNGNDFCLDDIRMDVTNPVPLPPSVLFLGSGLLGLGLLRYRRR